VSEILSVKILYPNDPIPFDECVLTIGTFDGIHIGHQKLISFLKQKQKPTLVLTFSNHPSELFTSRSKNILLSHWKQKMSWLKQLGIDYMYLIPFTHEFTQFSYDAFLIDLHKKTGFSHLVLGKGARFGKNKEGTEEKVKGLEKKWGFTSEYIPHLACMNQTVSSSAIRKMIWEGNLKGAEAFLGRPYSIFLETLEEGTISLPMYVLPPKGKYSAHIQKQNCILEVINPDEGLIIVHGNFSERLTDVSIVISERQNHTKESLF